MYFNKKYKRVGPLFQSVYKAVPLSNESQFLHLSRYIHKQALASKGETLQGQPCSYNEYLGLRKTEWIKPDEILSYFSTTNPTLSYESFVKQEEDFKFLKKIKLED